MMDLSNGKNIKPMPIGKEMAPFGDLNYIYGLKWDGKWCVAYLEPGKPPKLCSKCSVRMLSKVPELAEISKQVKKRCILDGELFILKDGCPDSPLIQRRDLMSDRLKIELDPKYNPAIFPAFDIPYYDCQETMLLPLMERKALLDKSITNGPRMAISCHIDGWGMSLFDLAIERELEKIVVKVKDSTYIQEKRTTDWIKMRVTMEDDYIVCGYILKSNHMTSTVLGQYRGSTLIYKGHATVGVDGQASDIISGHSTLSAAPFIAYLAGHGNDRVVWFSPDLICIVKFMHRIKPGGIRQPVFRGSRFDKLVEECIESV